MRSDGFLDTKFCGHVLAQKLTILKRVRGGPNCESYDFSFLQKAAGGCLVLLSPKTSAAPQLQFQQPIIPAVHNSGVFGCFGSKLDPVLPVVDAQTPLNMSQTEHPKAYLPLHNILL